MNATRIAFVGVAVLLAANFNFVHAQRRGAGGRRNSNSAVGSTVASGALNQAETDALIGMMDEEKLAHDVYVTLHQSTSRPLFSTISQAESRHVNALRSLAQRYHVDVPRADSTPGEFMAPKYKTLYKQLVATGKRSPLDAAKVGAKIEELDIVDLSDAIAGSRHEEVSAVYRNLQRASRNHLRAYSNEIRILGGAYRAEYLSQREFDRIADSPVEPGGHGGRMNGQWGKPVGGSGADAGMGRGKGAGRGNGMGRGNRRGRGRGQGAGRGRW